jgi:RNA polymerase sigma-70 factor, ECF subfamily
VVDDDEEREMGVLLGLRPMTTRDEGLAGLFRAHGEAVYRSAYRVTGDPMDAEDVLQTVFLRVAQRDAGLDPAGPAAGAYLRRAAINAALDLIRARARHPVAALDAVPDSADHGAGGTAGGAAVDADRAGFATEARAGARDARPAEEAVGLAELRAALRAALARESPRSAEVFALRYLEGYDNREIARLLGTSPSAVGVVLHRTRSRLRLALAGALESAPADSTSAVGPTR